MSSLIIGISHASAPLAVMERVVVGLDSIPKLLASSTTIDHVTEAVVLATCNRVEIYAEVDRFHGTVEHLSRLLMEGSGLPAAELLPHLYVHYEAAAVAHLFAVAAGLDSVAVGEAQILGQVRKALRVAQDEESVGSALNLLFQQALRVSKRAHAETDIDRAAPSLVASGLDLAARQWPERAPLPTQRQLRDLNVLIVGAGSMASLAAGTAADRGARITVVNRSLPRARRLAAQYDGHAAPLADLPTILADADVVVTCVGAPGTLIGLDDLTPLAQPPRAFVDLALPRDVDHSVAALPGVRLLDLATLAEELREEGAGFDIEAVRDIVAGEVHEFCAGRHQARVNPTVVALRAMATDVVEAETSRLEARLSGVGPNELDEIRQALRRVADKLVHQPTVQVRRLTGETGDGSYAEALAALFALDPEAIEAVTRPEVG